MAGRVRMIREDLYGAGGVVALARSLGLPTRTWLNYEGGITIPGDVLLRYVLETGAEPLWLLEGRGERYRTPRRSLDASPTPQG